MNSQPVFPKIVGILFLITGLISLIQFLTGFFNFGFSVSFYSFLYIVGYFLLGIYLLTFKPVVIQNSPVTPVTPVSPVQQPVGGLHRSGLSLAKPVAPGVQNTPPPPAQPSNDPNDQPNIGMNIVCFFIPLLGLILYLSQKDQFPRKAKSAGVSAIWGVVAGVGLSILSFVASMIMISSM